MLHFFYLLFCRYVVLAYLFTCLSAHAQLGGWLPRELWTRCTIQYTVQLAVTSSLRYTEHKRLRQWHLLWDNVILRLRSSRQRALGTARRRYRQLVVIRPVLSRARLRLSRDVRRPSSSPGTARRVRAKNDQTRLRTTRPGDRALNDETAAQPVVQSVP